MVEENIVSSLNYIFDINPAKEKIIIAFPIGVQSITFYLDYFLNPEFFSMLDFFNSFSCNVLQLLQR